MYPLQSYEMTHAGARVGADLSAEVGLVLAVPAASRAVVHLLFLGEALGLVDITNNIIQAHSRNRRLAQKRHISPQSTGLMIRNYATNANDYSHEPKNERHSEMCFVGLLMHRSAKTRAGRAPP